MLCICGCRLMVLIEWLWGLGTGLGLGFLWWFSGWCFVRCGLGLFLGFVGS